MTLLNETAEYPRGSWCEMVAAIYDMSIEQGATFEMTVYSLPASTTFVPSVLAEVLGRDLVASRPTTGNSKGDLWYDATLTPTARWSRWSGTAWANVTPTDLTGWSARLMFRKTFQDATAILSLTSPSVSGKGLDLGGQNGSVTIKIPAADTTAVDATWAGNISGVYDLEVFDTSTPVVVNRIAQGKWNLVIEATRPTP